ncbi:MAG: hypothetical protein AB1384_04475 [Actinomycetota bacterium]
MSPERGLDAGGKTDMTTMAEKLGMVRETEKKAEQVVDYYRRMAEETIAAARDGAEKARIEAEERAREEGEQEMREIIEHARAEAEELRVEYMYDRMRLLAVVVEKRKEAVAFLVEKLEKGE